jgi:hypothetical protein
VENSAKRLKDKGCFIQPTEGQSQLLVGSKRLSDSQCGQQKVIGQENEPTRSLSIEGTGGPKLGRINESRPWRRRPRCSVRGRNCIVWGRLRWRDNTKHSKKFQLIDWRMFITCERTVLPALVGHAFRKSWMTERLLGISNRFC